MWTNWKKRNEALRSVAYLLNLDFSDSDTLKEIAYLRTFDLFKTGSSKKVRHLMTSRNFWDGEQLSLFDYSYTISNGKSSTTYHQTVYFINSKALGIPEFRLKPETLLHKIGHLLGIQDIDFEEYPVFSRQYELKSREEDLVRSFFDHRVLHFFSNEKKWHVQAIGYFFVFYRHKSLVPPGEIEDFLGRGNYLYKLFRENTPDISLPAQPSE